MPCEERERELNTLPSAMIEKWPDVIVCLQVAGAMAELSGALLKICAPGSTKGAQALHTVSTEVRAWTQRVLLLKTSPAKAEDCCMPGRAESPTD